VCDIERRRIKHAQRLGHVDFISYTLTTTKEIYNSDPRSFLKEAIDYV